MEVLGLPQYLLAYKDEGYNMTKIWSMLDNLSTFGVENDVPGVLEADVGRPGTAKHLVPLPLLIRVWHLDLVTLKVPLPLDLLPQVVHGWIDISFGHLLIKSECQVEMKTS